MKPCFTKNVCLYAFQYQSGMTSVTVSFLRMQISLRIFCRKGKHMRPESRQNLRQMCMAVSHLVGETGGSCNTGKL